MDQNLPKTYSIVAVCAIIALVVAGYFVLNTFLPGYNQAQVSLVATNTTNTNLKKALSSVQTFLTNYEKQGTNTTRADLALPAGDADLPNFLSSMSQLASASGVSLSNFQIDSPVSDATDTPVPFSIQTRDFGVAASGSFESFKDFLSRLEGHLRLVDIYHVSVSTGASSVGTGTSSQSILQFQIKVHTYFQE